MGPRSGNLGMIFNFRGHQLSWDYELEGLIIDCKEMKTGDTDKMNFFSDASSKLLDFHHSLVCYLIFDCGKSALTASSDANWIVPDLARIQEQQHQL
jgi:hypothetical protein